MTNSRAGFRGGFFVRGRSVREGCDCCALRTTGLRPALLDPAVSTPDLSYQRTVAANAPRVLRPDIGTQQQRQSRE